MAGRLGTLAIGLAAAALMATAAAADVAEPSNEQVCGDEASALQLSGDALASFLADCGALERGSPRQVRLKSCTAQAEARKLSGVERREFLATCQSAE